ncbi:hypothetical protein H072_2389 [Dactylellina haptotyla CBS 200.50]|uniref:Calcineurin-like phosphoesterase domain-containing protein n=1 Tax=Dactylellina haptotyla (strain CBS 200.50) TaxID=1284197 RepID=S8BW09_DACHA|nr:hypothetical protein H072_2389 [Dactylellina haptotyla CBS 200.50]
MSSNDQRLQFKSDGTFQITVFSDFHYGEVPNGDGPIKDAKTAKVVSSVLNYENTQLVVLNGDLITGDGTQAHNSTNYLDQVVAPIVKANLPWASAYGNHDNQPNLSSENIFKREKTYKNSLTQKMVPNSSPATGVTNYYIPVYGASDSQEVPELLLWFFDSRGGYWYGGPYSPSNKRPDWVDTPVAEWFEKTNIALKKQYGKAIPSLAFFHIPVNSTLSFQQKGVDPNKEPGFNLETVTSQGRQYPKSYQDWDVPFMKALLHTEGLLATFSGHDHWNDWCFKWNGTIADTTLAGNGVNMCYGRHTGYGGYGTLDRGGRQILLKKDSLKDQVMTWIRLENGLITGNVTLNSTYGKDQYSSILHKRNNQSANLGYATTQDINSIIILLFLTIFIPLKLWN